MAGVFASILSAVSSPAHRDWRDYATLRVAAAAAVGTIGASTIALFGPKLRALQRQPEIYVRCPRPTMSQSRLRATAPGDQSVTPFTYDLGNRRGRETARDAELFISIARGVTA
jgi:hypothetical protein